MGIGVTASDDQLMFAATPKRRRSFTVQATAGAIFMSWKFE